MPPDVADMVSGLLRKHVLSLLSLSKKAGEAVAGFMKVEEILGRGRARLLFHAVEAAPDGCRKLDKYAQPGVDKIVLFHSSELDLAFGRSNVIHAAVGRGKLADKLLLAVQRIEMYDAHSERLVTEERA